MPPLQLTAAMAMGAWWHDTNERLKARKLLRPEKQRAARKGAETRRARA